MKIYFPHPTVLHRSFNGTGLLIGQTAAKFSYHSSLFHYGWQGSNSWRCSFPFYPLHSTLIPLATTYYRIVHAGQPQSIKLAISSAASAEHPDNGSRGEWHYTGHAVKNDPVVDHPIAHLLNTHIIIIFLSQSGGVE